MGTSIYLKPKEEIRIKNGHSWVYSNEISRMDGEIVSGQIASVFSSKGEFLGKGFLNTASKIFVRILSRKQEQEIDKAFFYSLIYRANQSKIDLGYQQTYRVVFGEADGISGLIVDKYGDYLVIQVVSYGIELWKNIIVEVLIDLFQPLGIAERSDVAVRIKEGLSETVGVLYGEIPETVIINEEGLLVRINLLKGQKTGYFLDQQLNHHMIKQYVKNKEVLDCFSHTGGFGLHAALHGARHVTLVDISQSACDQIHMNADLNHLKNITVVKADVFDLLRKYQTTQKKFDVVILDPPAFTKSSEHLQKAYAGYKEINLQAMKIVENGGYLYTCSCSHYMTPALFLQMLSEAAADSSRMVQMVEFRTQGKDHPTLLGSEETLYLKCVVLRINDYV
ncbi:MAG: class I SAM-dependent rRNA methyltransferase [bacterium]|nr:class I SAM-dependent rRNA methyltransferase [bacterium]